MIYSFPNEDAPIRQGDIFINLPRIDISLREIVVFFGDQEQEVVSWDKIHSHPQEYKPPIPIIVAARPVWAIVISQDCDAARGPEITLCEIRAFQDVERKTKDTKKPGAWVDVLTQHARVNQKWFYLPPDPKIGFDSKMGVDFLTTIRISYEDLSSFRHLRKGRLNELAEAHFRERIGEFFRRYAYDEWYALNKEELDVYTKKYPEVKPFPWQADQVTEPSENRTEKDLSEIAIVTEAKTGSSELVENIEKPELKIEISEPENPPTS